MPFSVKNTKLTQIEIHGLRHREISLFEFIKNSYFEKNEKFEILKIILDEVGEDDFTNFQNNENYFKVRVVTVTSSGGGLLLLRHFCFSDAEP